MATPRKAGPSGGDRKLRYQQVQELVLTIMAERDLRPGDRLPSTTELADIADVSTISVRRALDELERAGRIKRHQGLGTFVAEPRIAADPTRPGELLQTLTDNQGRAPAMSTSLIAISVGLPSATIAAALGVSRIEVEGVATFYHFFTPAPAGRYAVYLNTNIVSVLNGRAEAAAAGNSRRCVSTAGGAGGGRRAGDL